MVLCRNCSNQENSNVYRDEQVSGEERRGAGLRDDLEDAGILSRRHGRLYRVSSPEGPCRRGPHALCDAHDLGRQGSLRGLDPFGRIPPRAFARRQRDRRQPLSRPSQVRRVRSDPERAQIKRGGLREVAMPIAELADLKTYMAEHPGAVIEDVARERNVTPRAVIAALPDGMVRIDPGCDFAAAMQDIAAWGEVTLIVHTNDAIFEFTGAIPAGEIGRGYFNLMQPKGLHGHLRHERCAVVTFVERPFMGKSSAFIAFINVDGGLMFKVFVGRDETRALRSDQLARFRTLAERIATKAATE